MRAALGVLAAMAMMTPAPAVGQARPAITSFVSDPILSSVRLAPDGRYVVALRSSMQEDELIRLDWRAASLAVLQRVRRGEEMNQIDWVEWKGDDTLILSVSTTRAWQVSVDTGSRRRPREGAETRITRLVALDRDGANAVQMFDGQTRRLAADWTSTSLVDPLPSDPRHVLVSAYGARGLTLWRANIATGSVERIDSAGWIEGRWTTDGLGNAVIRTEFLTDAHRVQRRGPAERAWTPFAEVRSGDRINSPDFDAIAPGPGGGLVWVAARPEGQDRSALYLFDAATGEYRERRYAPERMDFEGDLWLSRGNERLIAACARYQRRECAYFDARVGDHIEAVDAFFGGDADVTLVDMSDDGEVWLIHVQGPTTAPSYHIYDRVGRNVIRVGGAQPNLEDHHLSPMQVVSYAARDGTELWGYLTVPRNAPETGAPMVVLPHGGPETRDYYDYDASVQFLASRGYLVFQPQFRGSGGFGNAFADAGRRQWGRRMQDDVTDGVRHLIASGRVDARRICIVGHSYGGYAALAGATLTPDLYRCAASINGVTDLREILRIDRAEQGGRSIGLDYWRRSMGDPSAERAAMDAVSPRLQAGAAQIPILLIAGAADEIVPASQSRIMRDALVRAGREVRYVEIPGAGHSWYSWRLEERIQLFTELERFLAQNLRP